VAPSLIGTPSEHEAGLIRFLRPDRRSRYKALLAKPQRRTKLLGTLPHTIRRDLDESYMTTYRGRPEDVARALRDKGAPEECFVISYWDREDDAYASALTEALADVIQGDGGTYGAFVSCIPGRLAYFHGEDIDARFILERTT
jgi:hypothetical protein